MWCKRVRKGEVERTADTQVEEMAVPLEARMVAIAEVIQGVGDGVEVVVAVGRAGDTRNLKSRYQSRTAHQY